MNHETINSQIIKYLKENGKSWGGPMCRKVHEDSGHKEAIIERRARELARARLIIAEYEQVDGKGPKCVRYRIKTETTLPPAHKPTTDTHQIKLL